MISVNVDDKSFSVVRLNELSTEDEVIAVRTMIFHFSCPFLECDSGRQKVVSFYEKNGFVFFSEHSAKSSDIKLLQFLKKI